MSGLVLCDRPGSVDLCFPLPPALPPFWTTYLPLFPGWTWFYLVWFYLTFWTVLLPTTLYCLLCVDSHPIMGLGPTLFVEGAVTVTYNLCLFLFVTAWVPQFTPLPTTNHLHDLPCLNSHFWVPPCLCLYCALYTYLPHSLYLPFLLLFYPMPCHYHLPFIHCARFQLCYSGNSF